MERAEREALQLEYQDLNKWMDWYRESWNRKANKALKAARRGIRSPRQGDFSNQWYRNKARWVELREQLGIKKR